MTAIKTFGEIKEFVRLSFISAKAKKPWGRLNIDPERLRPNNYEVAKSRRGGGIGRPRVGETAAVGAGHSAIGGNTVPSALSCSFSPALAVGGYVVST